MIEIDVSGNRLLKQVHEQGVDAAYPLFLLQRIDDSIKRNGLQWKDDLRAQIWNADVEEIRAFSDGLEDAPNKQGFLDNLRIGRLF